LPDHNKMYFDCYSKFFTFELAKDTDSAVEMLKNHEVTYYTAIITDMGRIEQRKGDPAPKEYKCAGLDFMIEARKVLPEISITIFSYYAATNQDIYSKCIRLGATNVVVEIGHSCRRMHRKLTLKVFITLTKFPMLLANPHK